MSAEKCKVEEDNDRLREENEKLNDDNFADLLENIKLNVMMFDLYRLVARSFGDYYEEVNTAEEQAKRISEVLKEVQAVKKDNEELKEENDRLMIEIKEEKEFSDQLRK